MSARAKICGLSTPAGIAAAVAGGAAFVGFNFYPPSPRCVTPAQARELAAAVPSTVGKVGLFVDPTDDDLARTLSEVPLDLLQLHGEESPARVVEIRKAHGLPVMKTIKVSDTASLTAAEPFLAVSDRLLFDALPPKERRDALPGGNALAFDWRLLAARRWSLPWMLAGGLNATNVAEAVRISGAAFVDISSGVEDRPGVKNPDLIRQFLAVVGAL